MPHACPPFSPFAYSPVTHSMLFTLLWHCLASCCCFRRQLPRVSSSSSSCCLLLLLPAPAFFSISETRSKSIDMEVALTLTNFLGGPNLSWHAAACELCPALPPPPPILALSALATPSEASYAKINVTNVEAKSKQMKY